MAVLGVRDLRADPEAETANSQTSATIAVGFDKGDLDLSVDLLRRADRCAPGRIEGLKELGVSEICRGQRNDDPSEIRLGLSRLREVTTLSPGKPTDTTDKQHSARILAEPQLACVYSRDGQAEVDREQLDP